MELLRCVDVVELEGGEGGRKDVREGVGMGQRVQEFGEGFVCAVVGGEAEGFEALRDIYWLCIRVADRKRRMSAGRTALVSR